MGASQISEETTAGPACLIQFLEDILCVGRERAAPGRAGAGLRIGH